MGPFLQCSHVWGLFLIGWCASLKTESCTQRRPNWTGIWLWPSNESAPFWWMLPTACRRGNGRDGPPIFANIFFSLPDSLYAAESITCAFSDVSALEKSQLFFSELICAATRERFFFHVFLRWRFQCLTYLSHLPGTLWRTSSCQQQEGGSGSDLTVSLCSASRFRADAL